MNLALLTDKVKLALLKRSGKAQGGSDRTYEGWKSKGYVKEPLISFVIQKYRQASLIPIMKSFIAEGLK